MGTFHESTACFSFASGLSCIRIEMYVKGPIGTHSRILRLGCPGELPSTFPGGPSSLLSRVSTIRQMLSALESRKEDKCRHTKARGLAALYPCWLSITTTSYFSRILSFPLRDAKIDARSWNNRGKGCLQWIPVKCFQYNVLMSYNVPGKEDWSESWLLKFKTSLASFNQAMLNYSLNLSTLSNAALPRYS